MTSVPYVRGRTALLLVDPYNDFLSPGGKLWPLVEPVARAVGLLDHLRAVLDAARASGVRVVVVPHHRWEEGDFESWTHATPYQVASAGARVFERGSWGGEWRSEFAPRPGDLVAKEHWSASGFAGTDLDVLLRQHDVRDVVVVGLLANTCIEVTARAASELGYRVTLVRDATAALSPEAMHSAHLLNGPTFAHAILSTAEMLDAFASLQARPVLAP